MANERKAMSQREAYRRGVRSRRTSVDWDDALVRFTARYCDHPTYGGMCALCHAWCDGFSELGFVERPDSWRPGQGA
jgi:hypothetical protein